MKLSGKTDQRFQFALLKSVIEFCTCDLSEKMNLEIMTPFKESLENAFQIRIQIAFRDIKYF